MFPILFRIGRFEISTFGLMAAIGFFAAYLILRAEMKRKGEPPGRLAPDLLLGAVVGGLLGARLNFAIEYWDVFVADPLSILLSRSGFVWYGGVIGGVIASILVLKINKQRIGPFADAAAPALAAGYFFGRAGCQLSGDGDYGVPTSLPWGMAYPEGFVPTLERVHPTPVYEMLIFAGIFFILWRLRKLERPPWWLFGIYLVLAGIERFGIEFLRPHSLGTRGNFPWEAQTFSILMILIGAAFVTWTEIKRRRSA